MRSSSLPVLLAGAFPLIVACAGGVGTIAPPAPGAPPSAPATPTAAPVAPTAAAAEFPAELLDLSDWSLTLPTGEEGSPDEVRQPELATYRDTWFRVDGTGVAFTANAGGATTENSGYPRSELRERTGSERAAWSNTDGVHVLSVRQAVTALPTAKPDVVTAQIHDGDDDVVEIRLEGARLLAEFDDGDGSVELDPDYRLGTPYDLEIVAADGRVRVSYNGVQGADLPLSGDDWYFKVGSYVQSNPERGEAPDTVGTVVVTALRVSHEP